MTEEFAIAGRLVGAKHRPYLIAEMSANHGGDIARAKRIVRLAAEAGADAIKLQAYTADDLTLASDASDFRLETGLWAGRTLHELYQSAATPYAWLEPLFAAAQQASITAFATPFSAAAAEEMARLNAPAYKIASFEAVDLELIRQVSMLSKPVLISTGLCTAEEIGRALETARSAGARDIALLKCTSAYPADVDALNLLTIADMAARFGVPVGYSDHSLGNAAPLAAVALGASLVEKHFIDAREPATADSAFSCLPDGLAALRRDIDDAWRARGAVAYGISPTEAPSVAYRRSLYIVAPVKRGETLQHGQVRSIRPGYGLPPAELERVLGRRAARDLFPGERLAWDMIED